MKTNTKISKKKNKKRESIEVPIGWFRSGHAPSDYEMGICKEVFHSGTQCAQIHSKVRNADKFGTLMQSIGTANFEGKRIRLSSFIKTKSVTDWSGLWMRIDEGKKMVAFDNMQYRPIRGNTDWTEYQVVLDVPKGSTNISFGVLLAGTGKVWFDDCKLEVVDKSVKLTDWNRSCGIRYQNEQPENMDFSKGIHKSTKDICLKSVPVGWFKQVRPQKDDPYKFEVKDKSVVIKSKKDIARSSSSAALLQALDAEKFVGKRVRLSGEMKTKIEKGESGLWIRADAGHELQVCHDYMEDRKVTGDTDWKAYNCVIDVPKETDNIYIGGTFSGLGTVRFRNFRIEAVSKKVPTTGKFGTIKRSSVSKSNPVNLNFEEV